MSNLELLGPEPIFDKTVKNADLFLKRNFQHYLNLSGMHRNQLSSPQLSLAPGSTNALNGVEKSVIDEVQDDIDIAEPARRAVSAIYRSMDNCTDTMQKPYRTIILGFYVEDKTIMDLTVRTSLAESTVKRKKSEALYEFSERLVYWKDKFNCDFLPELRVWKSCSNTL